MMKLEGIKQIYRNFIDSITNIWAIFLGTGVHLMPHETPLRIFIFSWLCYSFAVETVFQSFLTSFLIEPIQVPYVNDLDELVKSKNKYGYAFFMERTFASSDDWQSKTIHQNKFICKNIDTCSKWVAYSRNYSVVLLDSMSDFAFASGLYCDSNGRLLMCLLKRGKVSLLHIGMVMKKGSLLLEKFNTIIDGVVEAGIFMQNIKLYLHERRLRSRRIKVKSLADEYCNLNLEHLQSAFYLLLFGHALSLAIVTGEMFTNYLVSRVLVDK